MTFILLILKKDLNLKSRRKVEKTEMVQHTALLDIILIFFRLPMKGFIHPSTEGSPQKEVYEKRASIKRYLVIRKQCYPFKIIMHKQFLVNQNNYTHAMKTFPPSNFNVVKRVCYCIKSAFANDGNTECHHRLMMLSDYRYDPAFTTVKKNPHGNVFLSKSKRFLINAKRSMNPNEQ